MTAGALVGGAALIRAFHEKCEKSGLDSAKLIEKMRIAVLRDWQSVDQTQAERDAIGLACNLIASHIAACLPTREQLAATALNGDDVYPSAAAALIVDRLAAHDEACRGAFAEDGMPRRFALDVVKRALAEAKNDADYAPLLTLDLVIEVAGGVGRLERSTARIEEAQGTDRVRDEAFQADAQAMLRELVEAGREKARTRHVSDDELLALARRVTKDVADVGQALLELDRVIDSFLAIREAAERGTNLGDLVDRAYRAVAAANERQDFEAGARAGEAAYDAWAERQKAEREAGLRLIDLNLEQARVRRVPEEAAHWVHRRVALESGGVSFDALRYERGRWYEIGVRRGLRFEMDVSIALADEAIARAESAAERAAALNDKAVSLRTQGERTGGAEGLVLLARAVAGV